MKLSLPLFLMASFLLLACGESSDFEQQSNPIIGGKPESGYPAVGALLFKSGLCSGTLITPRLVLTAAHCSDGGAAQEFVLGPALDKATHIIKIDKFERHPSYSNVLEKGHIIAYHDIAVAVLKQKAPVDPMPFMTETLTNDYLNKALTFVGYGNTKTGGWSNSNGVKHSVTVTLGAIWKQGFWNYTKSSDPKNTCGGDSGGPGFMTVGGVQKIVGVVSSGDFMCNQNGYNTRIDTNASWIAQMIKKHDPDSVAGFCGDGTCGPGETEANCPADCKPQGPVCGNGICETGETSTTCPADCATPSGLWGDCGPNQPCQSGLLCVVGLHQNPQLGNCTQTCQKPDSWDGCPAGYYCVGLENSSESGVPGACVPSHYLIICGDGLCSSPVENAQNCPQDCAEQPSPDKCQGIPYEGCCDGEIVKYCDDGTLKETDCTKKFGVHCGWSASSSFYACMTDGSADPSKKFPKACSTYSGPVCGNGKCEAGETSINCPQDCGAAGPLCGDGKCEAGETSINCPQDCGPLCGNGVCETGENTTNCPEDCSVGGPVCGNGKCETGETSLSCPQDCGPVGAVCGNGKCEAGETELSCPQDCKPQGPVCGDGVCEPPETSINCLADCGPAGPVCGDLVCDATENSITCPQDCGENPESCGLVLYQGCCDGSMVLWCEGDKLKSKECAANPQCGWNAKAGIYDCKTLGAADPMGVFPYNCQDLDKLPICGNGLCEVGENGHNCPADCSSGKGECGNNVCEGRENCANCPSDCGICDNRDPNAPDPADNEDDEDTIGFSGKTGSSCAVSHKPQAGNWTIILLMGLLFMTLKRRYPQF